MDLISRQAAIDIVRDECRCGEQAELIEELEALPSAQPERRPGHWIVHRDWIDNGECGYECSECHRCYDYAMNFCGYCGAKMEVEHE